MNASKTVNKDNLIKILPSANLVYDSHPTITPPSFVNIVEFLRAHWAMNNDVCQQIQLGDYSLWKSECTWTFLKCWILDTLWKYLFQLNAPATGGSARLLCDSTLCYFFSFFFFHFFPLFPPVFSFFFVYIRSQMFGMSWEMTRGIDG